MDNKSALWIIVIGVIVGSFFYGITLGSFGDLDNVKQFFQIMMWCGIALFLIGVGCLAYNFIPVIRIFIEGNREN